MMLLIHFYDLIYFHVLKVISIKLLCLRSKTVSRFVGTQNGRSPHCPNRFSILFGVEKVLHV